MVTLCNLLKIIRSMRQKERQSVSGWEMIDNFSVFPYGFCMDNQNLEISSSDLLHKQPRNCLQLPKSSFTINIVLNLQPVCANRLFGN